MIKLVSIICTLAFTPLCADLDYTNWQDVGRGAGLRSFDQVVHNTLTTNPSNTLPLYPTFHADYEIYQLPSVQELQNHPALDGLVVLYQKQLIHEYYGPLGDPNKPHSSQSATKTIISILLDRLLQIQQIDLNTKIKKIIPNMGSGYAEATFQDVLNMNVINKHDELASYIGKADHVAREESGWGWRKPLEGAPEFPKDYILSIQSDDTSNRTEIYSYKSPNTTLCSWIIETIKKEPLQQQVLRIMEEVQGENAVSIVVDKTGWPCCMGGLIMTTRDFARYGLLLANMSPEYLRKLRAGGVSMGPNNLKYHNQCYTDGKSIGHAGWGGQWIWVHPETQTVVSIHSSLESANPAPPEYAKLMFKASQEIVEYFLKRKQER